MLSWRDVEAEHHPALVVLGDVAVRHPTSGIGDIEEDVESGFARGRYGGALTENLALAGLGRYWGWQR